MSARSKPVPGRWAVMVTEQSPWPQNLDGSVRTDCRFFQVRRLLCEQWAQHVSRGRCKLEGLQLIVATEAMKTCGPDFRLEYAPGMVLWFVRVDQGADHEA